MVEQSNQQNLELRAEPAAARTSRSRRVLGYGAFFAVLGTVSLAAGFETARRALPQHHAESASSLADREQTAAPVRLPASEANADAEFQRLPLQERAERLLAGAMRHDERSLNLLREGVDGWRGRLKSTDHLFEMVLAALNSTDLRVRTAAIDVDLAASNLSKTPQSVEHLLQEIQSDPGSVGMSLWRLGALGNRGVEPEKVLRNLLLYSRSRNEHTRYWAVEGLSMLGNDGTIDPLLEMMAHDISPRVRELAASSLAEAGMLTREERLAAIPHLLNLADDDSLNTATRELVYGALRVITGANLGNDASAWREWWANHDPAKERPRQRTAFVRA